MDSPFAPMLMDMGFSYEKVMRALEVTGNQGVEPAMEWLLAHAEELDAHFSGPTANAPATANLPEPLPAVQEEFQGSEAPSGPPTGEPKEGDEASEIEAQGAEAKSIKCNDCGKLFTSNVAIEFHATKTGHANFSESTEEKKPLTEEERKEQVRLLEEKIKEKRKEREEKEKQEALEREKNRIKSGKEIVAAKKKLEDEELRKAIDQRKREKEEDRLARQRVKNQIEADKAARRAKQSGEPTPPPAPVVAATPAEKKPQQEYTQTRLQIRLTNGNALTQSFGAKEQLSAVRLFIEMNRTDGNEPFSLMTSFPRKVFTDDDFDKPLDLLGLVPSAVLIVSKRVTPY